MSDQIENERIIAELSGKVVDLNATIVSQAASTYAYNKINNLLLMQVLAKLENRDLEEIRANVDRYLVEFADEFLQKNKQLR